MCERMSSELFRNFISNMCIEIIYLIYMYKKDLTLNNLQYVIKANQTKS